MDPERLLNTVKPHSVGSALSSEIDRNILYHTRGSGMNEALIAVEKFILFGSQTARSMEFLLGRI